LRVEDILDAIARIERCVSRPDVRSIPIRRKDDRQVTMASRSSTFASICVR